MQRAQTAVACTWCCIGTTACGKISGFANGGQTKVRRRARTRPGARPSIAFSQRSGSLSCRGRNIAAIGKSDLRRPTNRKPADSIRTCDLGNQAAKLLPCDLDQVCSNTGQCGCLERGGSAASRIKIATTGGLWQGRSLTTSRHNRAGTLSHEARPRAPTIMNDICPGPWWMASNHVNADLFRSVPSVRFPRGDRPRLSKMFVTFPGSRRYSFLIGHRHLIEVSHSYLSYSLPAHSILRISSTYFTMFGQISRRDGVHRKSS
jgi:hypothetical protein